MTYQQSENIGELSQALAKAQAEMQGAAKDSKNPFFKSDYADLASVIFSVKGPLAANDLAFVQFVGNNQQGWPEVTTQLSHKSGQWMRNALALEPKKRDPQGMGSAITYARRYSLASMVGVPQVDDDGNEASRPKTSHKEKRIERKRPQPKENKRKSLKTMADAKKACPEITEDTVLKSDDFGSRSAFAGQTLKECKDWQDECVKIARMKGWDELSKVEQAFAILANHCSKSFDPGYKSSRVSRTADIKAALS